MFSLDICSNFPSSHEFSLQTGYTTIKEVLPNGDLFMGTPNREVREMLSSERLKLITGCLRQADVDQYASYLIDGEFELARATLERMIKALPDENQPWSEPDFSMCAFSCFQRTTKKFLAAYVDLRQTLDGEKIARGRPDACIVFSREKLTHAIVIELKFGSGGDSAAKGLQQIVSKRYVDRAVKYVNNRMKKSLLNPSPLDASRVSYFCFKLNDDMSVTMEVPTRGTVAERASPKPKRARAGAAKSAPPATL